MSFKRHSRSATAALVAATPAAPGLETLNQPLAGREAEMHQNDAGSYVFTLNKWGVLERFLISGSEGGTFYVSEQTLTERNTQNLLSCIQENPTRVNNMVRTMDAGGRLFRKKYAVYALAMLATPKFAGQYALPLDELYWGLLRTGSDLLLFVSIVKTMRGWGEALKRAVGEFYRASSVEELDDVAFQVTKYRNRYGWTHGDVIRCLHLRPRNEYEEALFSYIRDENRWARPDVDLPASVANSRDMRSIATMDCTESYRRAMLCTYIKQHNIPREWVPTEYLNKPDVLYTLAMVMPATALLRNLRNIANCFFDARNEMQDYYGALHDVSLRIAEQVKKVHPYQAMQALAALMQLPQAGELETWMVALEEYIMSIGQTTIPQEGNHLVAIDVSGSMTDQYCASGLNALQEAALVGYSLARNRSNVEVLLFSQNAGILPTDDLTPRQFIGEVLAYEHGGTHMDKAIWLMDSLTKEKNVLFNSMTVITDNEVNGSGNQHCAPLVKAYRENHKVNTRFALIGLTATSASVADPKDKGMADFVGFDATSMQILGDFLQG